MKDINIVLQEHENARILLTAFQIMLDNTTDMVFIKDSNLIYLAATQPFVKMVGKKSLDDVIGHSDLELFEDPDLAKRYIADDRKMFASGENLIDFIEPIPADQGRPRYGTTSKYILTDGNGRQIGLLGVTRDVTKDILAKQNHQRELEYLFKLPPDAYAAVFIDITDWRIIGERRQPVEDVVLPCYDNIDLLTENALRYVPDQNSAHLFYQNLNRESMQNIYNSGKRNIALEYQRFMPDGNLHWVKSDITFLYDPDTAHLCAMMVLRDIDSQKQAEQQILQAAETDEMTGLLNRSATMKHIQSFLSECDEQKSHALLMIDVDNFKSVNDTLGHQAGDQLLIRLAQAIKSGFRSTDIIGRIGGDEFFVLMKDASSREAVEERATALLLSIQSICKQYDSLNVSGSVGICLSRGEQALDNLYEQADQAMYQAKRKGKNCVFFAEAP